MPTFLVFQTQFYKTTAQQPHQSSVRTVLETSNISENITINNLNTFCEIDFVFEGIKILKKNDANVQSNTFDQGLTVIKKKDKIKILLLSYLSFLSNHILPTEKN